MHQEFTVNEHWNDADGNPAGGCISGPGFTASFQNGPLGRGEDRKEPNGCFVEDLLEAAKSRLEFYQESKFDCADNVDALACVNSAIRFLNNRTARREESKTEGTHQGN